MLPGREALSTEEWSGQWCASCDLAAQISPSTPCLLTRGTWTHGKSVRWGLRKPRKGRLLVHGCYSMVDGCWFTVDGRWLMVVSWFARDQHGATSMIWYAPKPRVQQGNDGWSHLPLKPGTNEIPGHDNGKLLYQLPVIIDSRHLDIVWIWLIRTHIKFE